MTKLVSTQNSGIQPEDVYPKLVRLYTHCGRISELSSDMNELDDILLGNY